MLQLFATCPRGLEAMLVQELVTLGASDINSTPGGIHFTGDWRTTAKVNLWSRIASRVLVRMGKSSYRGEEDVYRAALGIKWSDYFSLDDTFRVHVTMVDSPLKSREFTTLRIKDAVCDQFREVYQGQRPSVETSRPDQRIHAFLDRQTVTLYLDASGEALFKRGYRQTTGEAPLRENLAAGILKLTGWQPDQTLMDPMCGSGTFLVEAAGMAMNIAPGLKRDFAAERWLHLPQDAWQEERATAEAAQREAPELNLFAADINPECINMVRNQFAANGWKDYLHYATMDACDASPPTETGIWLCNPPYGVRLSEEEELARLYPQLGSCLKNEFDGWRAFFFTGDTKLPKLIGLKPQTKVPLFNGAIECRLYEFVMRAGSWKDKDLKAGKVS